MDPYHPDRTNPHEGIALNLEDKRFHLFFDASSPSGPFSQVFDNLEDAISAYDQIKANQSSGAKWFLMGVRKVADNCYQAIVGTTRRTCTLGAFDSRREALIAAYAALKLKNHH